MARKTQKKEADAADLVAGPPTLKSIAFITGYSITTVSRALKDAPDIGQEAKDRVRLVAKQIGYRPNRAGVRLRTGKTNVISLVLNTEEEVMGLTSQMVFGISEVLRDTPYHLVVTPYSLQNDPMDPVRYVVETGSADGIILSRMELQDRRVRYLTEHGMPFATHGRTDMGIEHPWHDFDNERFGRDAVARLARHGVRRAALIAPPDILTYARHIKTGFAAGLREHRIQQTLIDTITVDDNLDTMQSGVCEMMRSPERPDGIVCSSGSAAIAATAGIEEAGFVVGRDVHIVSKQHTNILKRFRQDIEVINEDVRQGGRDLATCVIRSIEGVPASDLHYLSYPDAPADDLEAATPTARAAV
ncbi:LacI family transcriptional regulator [Oricola sp.]|uniref:LacI family transcriptional regulator n=1 Tax=Oricola sp. TaxID=1979950 RepID=UPI0025D1EC87|nr:LacI family transcriptional regulator [Oricola sp.]MCI5078288.1 LacI family transcriptional regulator [Oricola sp.]